MDNEDKILSMLERMDARLDKLEAGQVEIRADINDLKAGQVKLEAGQAEITKDVKAIREQTEHLTEFEAKTDLNFKKISNDINTLKHITKDNLYDIAELKMKAV